MAVIKCANGHYYDDSKHSACPHCNNAGVGVTGGAAASPQELDKTVPLEIAGAGAVKPETEEVDVVVNKPVNGEDMDKTMSAFSFECGTEKVTGWLVCTEGPQCGRDYRIFHGWTRIGRDANMTICIPGDSEMSRNSHFAIVYDNRSGKFFGVNENGATTYINGEELTSPVELKYGDEFKAGKTTMVFIPFCTEERKW